MDETEDKTWRFIIFNKLQCRSPETSSSKSLFPFIPQVKLVGLLSTLPCFRLGVQTVASFSVLYHPKWCNGHSSWFLRLIMKESTSPTLRWTDYKVCGLYIFFRDILSSFVLWYRKRLSAEKWKLSGVDKLWLYVERCRRRLTPSNENQESR